jgi:hypothetical protein
MTHTMKAFRTRTLRTAMFCALAALAACAGSTVSVQDDADRPAVQPDLTTMSAIFESAIPANIEVKRTSTGHLLVKPTVNGRQPGWFIFDTGAGICCVSTPHIAELNLRDAGSIGAVGVGGSGGKKLYRADSVALGPLTLTDHPIMAVDFSFLKQHLGEEIYGVIGYGVLSHAIVELDIEMPRIAIHAPDTYVLRQADWQSLELDDRIPAVRCTFEGHEGLFRLDSGADGHITFHQPAVEQWSLLEGRRVTNMKMGGVGGFVAAKKGEIEWIEIGGRRYENIPALFATEARGAFADSRKQGNIGAELLRKFILVFDYPENRIAFIPRDAAAAARKP